MASRYNSAPFDRKSEEEQIQILIAYMNILKKNIGTYPPGHSAILKFEETVSIIIKKIFSNTSTITINAIKSNLLVNGKLYGTKNIHIQDFTIFVSRLGIASLILRNGLDIKELKKFCQLALSIPANQHIYQHKNILHEINASPHILVREIDLSAVRFIDEDMVKGTKTRESITAWQKLMIYCLSPDFQNTWDSDLLKMINIYDQGSLINFIQIFNVPENRVVNSYEIVLKDKFQSLSEESDEELEKQRFFRSIYKDYKDFSPEVREQLFSVTYEVINGSDNEEHLEEVLKCMPPDMVVEVLTQAVIGKKIISPVLLKILTMLYKSGSETGDLSDEQKMLNKTVWHSIEELFSREGYEKYLSEEYNDHLQQLSMGGGGGSKDKPVDFETDEYLKTLQYKSVNRHVTTALMFLMQGNIEEQIYCNYADNIAQAIPEMLEAGEYKSLVILHKYLRKHLQANKGPAACDAINAVLRVYSDHHFITKLSEAYETKKEGRCPEIDELIMITGSVNLPWLTEQYLQQGANEEMHQTLNLILRLGPQASEFASKKLDAGDDNQKIALLKLIRYCPGNINAGQVPKLLQSKNMEVRLEALKVLVKINHPAAVPALWKMICAKDNKIALKALKIVHAYQVNALAPKLISQIKTFYVSKNSFVRNKAILILLANLGNDNLLPLIKKKIGTRFSVSPSYLKQTKEYFFDNLNKQKPST